MRLAAGALVLVVSCASRGPVTLSVAQLQSHASRTISGAFDEVYDATWLTLEAEGWAVTASDRRAGTFSTAVVVSDNGLGRAWSVSVSQESATVALALLPRIYQGDREVTGDIRWLLEGPGSEAERWAGLFAGVTALVEAWRVHPELGLSNTRGEVDAVGLRLLVPNWPHFTFSVDRRTLVMKRAGTQGVATLLYRIERRRPVPDLEALVNETLEQAFHAEGRIEMPSQWDRSKDAWGQTGRGAVQVGADLTAREVQWRRWEAGTPAWVVRVAGACPEPEEINGGCDGDVRRVIESAVNTAAVPGIRSR